MTRLLDSLTGDERRRYNRECSAACKALGSGFLLTDRQRDHVAESIKADRPWSVERLKQLGREGKK